MEFGVEKCAVLTVSKGKMAKSDGIVLANQIMEGLKADDSYNYLGLIQADGIKHHEMKENSKQYHRWVRKILETELNGGNIITGKNTWATSLLRYSRKLWTMHQALNRKSDVARIYLSRNEGRRGIISSEATVKLAIPGF